MEKALKQVAIMYDFDKTLCTKNMQEYSLIPDIGMTPGDFWKKVGETAGRGKDFKMDSIIAYLYLLQKEYKERLTPLKRSDFEEPAKKIEFFNGLDTWFDRINEYGKELGLDSKESYKQHAIKFANTVDRKNCVSFVDVNSGATYKYNKKTSELAIITKDGYVATYFKPKDGYSYYKKEKDKRGSKSKKRAKGKGNRRNNK